MARDLYQELGVARGATADDIRKAFRKLAKAHHPDVNPGDKKAEDRFKRASSAFEILGDPEKRRKYDAGEIDADGRESMAGFGQGPFGSGPFSQSPFGGQGGGFRSTGFDGVDLNDILGGVFGASGGRGGGFSPRGADVRARLEIDLADAITGAKKRVPFADGRVLDLTIPKGVVEGQTLRLKGQGGAGRGGSGDALIEIAFRPHSLYRREGDNLIMDLPVSIPDAVLGGKVEAVTPDGPVTLTVPKGSNSGAVLRLKGRGMPNAAGRRGDLLARVTLTLPDAADPDLEAFAETWRAERPYQPRRRG